MNDGDLQIQYGATDTVTVHNQNELKGRIERLELGNGNYLTNNDIDLIVQNINAYANDAGMMDITNTDIRNNQDMMNIISTAWRTQ